MDYKLSVANNSHPIVTYPTTISKAQFYYITLWYGVRSSNIAIDYLKIKCNGSYYSLKELVDNELIEPLVTIKSAASMNAFREAIKVYGNMPSGNGAYPALPITFTTKQNSVIEGLEVKTSGLLPVTGEEIRTICFDTDIMDVVFKG